MQSLGLTPAEDAIYRAHIFSDHDFTVALDVLDQDGKVLSSIVPTFLDGQVNLNRTRTDVPRTATFSVFDPDHTMGIDTNSPWDGAVTADRQIRARHVTFVPELDRLVTAIPFVGPLVKPGRNGDILSLEAQDRSALGMTPCPPLKVSKGMRCVEAIRKIMSERTGETRFRFPANSNRRLNKPLNVGWSDDATPWKVCQKIAALLGMELFYSCDGWLTLQPLPTDPALTLNGKVLTEPVDVDPDLTVVRNHARVSGTIPPAKKGAKAQAVTRTASVAPSHAMRAQKIGRHKVDGTIVPRYLPVLVTGENFKKASEAEQLAELEIKRNESMTVATTVSCIPFFDGDLGDLVQLETDAGMTRVRLDEAAIPLGVSGDMSIGYQKPVSKTGVQR